MKDVPTDQDPRLSIAAYLSRADARDALVVRSDATFRSLADLPPGSRIGTDSPRRTGFLLAQRPDLVVHALHGNVDTRLKRLDSGETDALVLACAGLDRLGLGDRIAERLAPKIVPPAPGQGAIAIQIRRDDARMLALAAAIDDPRTRRAVEAVPLGPARISHARSRRSSAGAPALQQRSAASNRPSHGRSLAVSS